MILLVFGDEVAAGAHLAKSYAWAYEDIYQRALGPRPHPKNFNLSFGYKTALMLHAGLVCGVGENSTFIQIRNSYQEFASKNKDIVPLISWSDENLRFIDEIEAWGAELPYAAFINSKKTFKPKCNKWIWNTEHYSTEIWAANNRYLKPNTAYVNLTGHNELANIVLDHLTKQMNLAILEPCDTF
jgi:hypothetical protein